MINFLLAILLWATGAKIITGSSAANYIKYDFAALAVQCEESEQEKGDQGNSKNDNEDKIFPHSIVNPFLGLPAKFLKTSWQQDAYLGFVNSPNTPPPDLV